MHLDIVYGCFQATMAEMSGCYRNHMTLQNLEYLLSVPLHLKFAIPDPEHQKKKEMTDVKDRTEVKSV